MFSALCVDTSEGIAGAPWDCFAKQLGHFPSPSKTDSSSNFSTLWTDRLYSAQIYMFKTNPHGVDFRDGAFGR